MTPALVPPLPALSPDAISHKRIGSTFLPVYPPHPPPHPTAGSLGNKQNVFDDFQVWGIWGVLSLESSRMEAADEQQLLLRVHRRMRGAAYSCWCYRAQSMRWVHGMALPSLMPCPPTPPPPLQACAAHLQSEGFCSPSTLAIQVGQCHDLLL